MKVASGENAGQTSPRFNLVVYRKTLLDRSFGSSRRTLGDEREGAGWGLGVRVQIQ
jgi:hypothetical protein